MATQAIGIQAANLAPLLKGASALTLDPYKNALYYFFPFLGAIFSEYYPLRSDPSETAMMPQGPTNLILREISDLTERAHIGPVVPYVALSHEFSSCGGSFSLTKPTLFLPYQHLFRGDGYGAFGQQGPYDDFDQNPWIYSDDETRFLIARELGQISENSAFLRVTIKVAMISALFTIYTASFGWLIGLNLFVAVLATYVITERLFQARADFAALEILDGKVDDSVQVAIQTLEKMRQQNLHLREESWLASWYITSSGNNLLDFTRPSLTGRIEALRAASPPAD